MQEDLSTLFSRNLNFSNSSQTPTPQQPEENHLLAAEAAQDARPITYITQHYHHSAHLAAPTRTDNPPPSNAAIISALMRHHIDPMSLSPAQFALFERAESEQRARLLGLWQISPPSHHDLAQEFSNWPATMEQEEAMARFRYETQMQANGSHMASVDEPRMELGQLNQDHRVNIIPMEGGDGRSIAEPYILSGYESLSGRDYIEQLFSEGGVPPTDSTVDFKGMAKVPIPQHMNQYNHCTEPVYQHREMWQKAVGQQLGESQYGAVDQSRQLGGSPNFSASIHGPLEDEEML